MTWRNFQWYFHKSSLTPRFIQPLRIRLFYSYLKRQDFTKTKIRRVKETHNIYFSTSWANHKYTTNMLYLIEQLVGGPNHSSTKPSLDNIVVRVQNPKYTYSVSIQRKSNDGRVVINAAGSETSRSAQVSFPSISDRSIKVFFLPSRGGWASGE